MADFHSDELLAVIGDPMVTIPGGKAGSELLYTSATFDVVGATHGSGDVFRMLRVSSNFLVLKLKISTPGITGLTDSTIGVHKPDDGSPVDADLWRTTFNLQTARNDVDLHGGTGGLIAPEDLDQPLWSLLGFNSDPGKDYDITITTAADPSGDGPIHLALTYVIP